MSDSLGIVDLKSELLVKNYDVNKQIDVVSNEFNWVSNSWVNKFGFENEFLGLIKMLIIGQRMLVIIKLITRFLSFTEL